MIEMKPSQIEVGLMKIMHLNWTGSWMKGRNSYYGLCGCFGDENVASFAEIEVQFKQRTNMCNID